MRNDNCKKKKKKKKAFRQCQQCFFLFLFLTFITLFSTVQLSTYLPYFFDSTQGEEMMRVPSLYVRAPSSITELGRCTVSL